MAKLSESSTPEYKYEHYEGPEPPTLTKDQERETKRILRGNNVYQSLVAGTATRYDEISSWSRPNLEQIGAGVFVSLDDSRDYADVTLPYISNSPELYGVKGEHQGIGIDPNVDPEIAHQRVTARNVTGFIVFVDLVKQRVADITPIGHRVRMRLKE